MKSLSPRERHAAIDPAGRVAGQAGGPGTLVAPDLTAIAGVERVALVRLRDVHHAVGHHRSALQAARVRDPEDPFRRDTLHVRFVDLSQRRVAIAAEVAVIRCPIDLGRDFAEFARVRSPQQVDPVVVGANLRVFRSFVEHQAVQRSAVGHREALAVWLESAARPERPDEGDQLRQLRVTDADGRHSASRQTFANQRCQLRILQVRRGPGDGGRVFSAVAVGAVTGAAAVLEDHFAGRVLGPDRAGQCHPCHEDRAGGSVHD